MVNINQLIVNVDSWYVVDPTLTDKLTNDLINQWQLFVLSECTVCCVYRLEIKQQKINELQEKIAIVEKQLAYVHHSSSMDRSFLKI